MAPLVRVSRQCRSFLVLFSAIYLQYHCSTTPSEVGPHQNTLEKRAFHMGGTGDSAPSNGTANSQNDPCGVIDLSPQAWVDLDIDNYIAKFPNADKLTLHDFAAQLGAPNFFCGIGMSCQAGQLCHPVSGVNWVILYAVQEWNNYMNSFYLAVEDAVDLMRDASSSIVNDFFPHTPFDNTLYGWSLATVIIGALAAVTALAVPLLLPLDAMAMVAEATAIGAGGALLGVTAIPEGGEAVAGQAAAKEYDAAVAALNTKDGTSLRRIEGRHNLEEMSRNMRAQRDAPASPLHGSPRANPVDNSHQASSSGMHSSGLRKRSFSTPRSLHKRAAVTPRDQKPWKKLTNPWAFTRWAFMDTHLTVLQNQLQSYVVTSSNMAISKPLLNKGGLASVLKDGSFLSPNPTLFSLTDEVRALAQLTALSEFFKSIKMFVTIGSDECKFNGPNGAWDHPEKLSYCTPDGLMMNIIRSEGEKSINNHPNASLLKTKYGYTTEFLAKKAWECQKKYGIFTEGKVPPAYSVKSECSFSIAVCDCTLPEVARLRRKHHKMTTVKACRKAAKLPI